MSLSEHFRKRRGVYRCVSAVVGLGVVLGWAWGTHPLWWLWAAVVFAWGAFVPEIEVPPAKVLFVVLMVPMVAFLWDRGGFGYRPWNFDANFIDELVITAVLTWALIAVAVLTFAPRIRDGHAI